MRDRVWDLEGAMTVLCLLLIPLPSTQVISDHGSHIEINLYPYFTWLGTQQYITLDYALGKPSASAVNDGSLTYTSLFDAMYDATRAALDRWVGTVRGVRGMGLM